MRVCDFFQPDRGANSFHADFSGWMRSRIYANSRTGINFLRHLCLVYFWTGRKQFGFKNSHDSVFISKQKHFSAF
jgi:hypothetical protein